MREAAFIKQNKEKWLAFEEALKQSATTNPDQLAQLFIQVNNDLSFAQTYYPKSRVIEYLNALAATAHNKIYSNTSKVSSFLNFWSEDIPLIMYQHRKYFYFAFGVYFMFFIIGWFSSIYEPEFVRSILGDSYVEMTQENIENGDPLAVYNNESTLGDFNSFFRIALNNLMVGFRTIIWGLPVGIGSAFVMMHNGIMVGAFQYMFYDSGDFWLSLRTIWIHGAMEIFAMCIEVGAGLLLGLSYLFPGSLTRKQAFFAKGKAAIKILMSTIPFTVCAAILEGFVTQYANEMHLIFSFGIVLSSLGLITWYYLIYPYFVNRRHYGNLSLTLLELSNEKA